MRNATKIVVKGLFMVMLGGCGSKDSHKDDNKKSEEAKQKEEREQAAADGIDPRLLTRWDAAIDTDVSTTDGNGNNQNLSQYLNIGRTRIQFVVKSDKGCSATAESLINLTPKTLEILSNHSVTSEHKDWQCSAKIEKAKIFYEVEDDYTLAIWMTEDKREIVRFKKAK